MKKTKEKPVLITIKGKRHYFRARIELWKAYAILANIEKYENEARKLENKRKKILPK